MGLLLLTTGTTDQYGGGTTGPTTTPEPGQLTEAVGQLLALQAGMSAVLIMLVGGLLWISIHRG